MEIGKFYKLESDALNVTLSKRIKGKKGTKAGKIYWKPVGYYSSFKQALKGLVNLGVKETGLTDLITVAKKQDELLKLISNLKD